MANLNVKVQDGNNFQVVVSRGLVGPAGPSNIGGYPINVGGLASYDALMFVGSQWTNIPQTEISDGGNF